MKTVVLSVVAATIMSATSAFAADLSYKAVPVAPPPSPWDWAFGGGLLTDYNFRGISQSNRGPSVTAYSETRYNVNSNWQLYAGTQYWAVTLPTNPTCECDLYAGIRPTFGPLAFDFGYIYYWYPRERQHNSLVVAPFPTYPNGNATLRESDYGEIYGKVVWEAMKDRFWLGANYYYSNSWLNTGASGAYGSITAKVQGSTFNLGMFSDIGWYVSGEVGHYWLGNADLYPGVFAANQNLPDYNTWNLGLAFTYKIATIDLRYYDSDLSKVNCNVLTGDPNALVTAAGVASKWCNGTFIGALKFDLSAMTNLK